MQDSTEFSLTHGLPLETTWESETERVLYGSVAHVCCCGLPRTALRCHLSRCPRVVRPLRTVREGSLSAARELGPLCPADCGSRQ